MINSIAKTLSFLFVISCSFVQAQSYSEIKIENKKVQAGCSKCVFHSSKKCSLAIEVDNKIYEVEGSSLKDHGKPRAKDGLCKVSRDAEVSGKIEDGKFVAYDFVLLPMIIETLPLLNEEDSDKL